MTEPLTITPVRCPAQGPRRLLFQVRQKGEVPTYVDGTLIELACDDCKHERRKRGESVKRVLHRFNILGELVETVVVRR